MKTFTEQNTEGFTQEELNAMNELYTGKARLLDTTSNTYDDDIKNLQDKILNNFYR